MLFFYIIAFIIYVLFMFYVLINFDKLEIFIISVKDLACAVLIIKFNVCLCAGMTVHNFISSCVNKIFMNFAPVRLLYHLKSESWVWQNMMLKTTSLLVISFFNCPYNKCSLVYGRCDLPLIVLWCSNFRILPPFGITMLHAHANMRT